MNHGVLGSEYDRADKDEIRTKVGDAEEAAKDEVWAGYRFVVVADNAEADGLKVIDLGAGHASGSQTLSGRVINALKAEGLLSESAGAGYIDRNWPPALEESGAWPLASLRQSSLNGSLTRLVDPDATLRTKIPDFVSRGEFGLGSGQKPDGRWERVWFEEMVAPDEIEFGSAVFLLRRNIATALKQGTIAAPPVAPVPPVAREPEDEEEEVEPSEPGKTVTLRLRGTIPAELWNRLGTKLIPKMRSANELRADVEFSVNVDQPAVPALERELRQIIADLGLQDKLLVSRDG